MCSEKKKKELTNELYLRNSFVEADFKACFVLCYINTDTSVTLKTPVDGVTKTPVGRFFQINSASRAWRNYE